jgi:hypothetical protein
MRSGIRLLAAAFVPILLLCKNVAHGSDDIETVVFVRHGEKPNAGLGQLDCQGLNRALALPAVIAETFGRPSAVFAPNPADQKNDDGEPYDYVRPLATIEPTAIFFGLPVNASIGVSNIDGLKEALEQPAYRTVFILVAWEHKEIETLARDLVSSNGGDASAVPKWHGDDFDSMDVVKIVRSAGTTSVSFELKHEGLDGQSSICPQ